MALTTIYIEFHTSWGFPAGPRMTIFIENTSRPLTKSTTNYRPVAKLDRVPYTFIYIVEPSYLGDVRRRGK
jgi:hypothetical protein